MRSGTPRCRWCCDPARNRRGRSAILAPLAAIGALLALAATAARAQDSPPASFRHEVEASFVYTIAKFVDWPPGAFPEAASPLIFALLGEDPIEESLARTVSGKTVGGHPIEVVRIRAQDDLVACHLLYVGRSEAARVDEVIESLRGSSTLTVGDLDRFAQRGGILRIRLEENLVRFEVNVDAAERARLQISSKILKLGKIVRDRQRRSVRRP